MGMIDQRDQRRRVVSDGQRQVQTDARDEHPRTIGSRGAASISASASAGEQRGIRLLADGDAGRALARTASVSASGGPGQDGTEPARGDDPTARRVEEQSGGDRSRRLRYDETHALPTADSRGGGRRAPGPLSARIALRQQRGAPATGPESKSPAAVVAPDEGRTS